MNKLLQKFKNVFFKVPENPDDLILFPGLGRLDVAVLQKYMHLRYFGFEEKIYEKDAPSAALYYINSGSVGFFTLVDDGHEERTRYISKGRWFGVSVLLDNGLRSHTARSLEHTELLVISKNDLDTLLVAEQIIGTRFLLTIIGELHATQVEIDLEYSKLLTKLSKSNIIV